MINKKISVSGIAIRPGISKNNINYTVEALEAFMPTMIDKPILKDHDSRVDNTVGVVVNSSSQGNGVIAYNGWVKEDGTNLIEKIKDGRIKEVSIGAFAKNLVKEDDDDEFYTAVGLEAMELSLTPTPAVKGTSLKQTLQSIEERKTDEKVRVQPVFESIANIQVKENVEVDNMAEEEQPKEEPVPAEAPVEVKEEPKVEEKIVEPVKVEQSIKINVDTSKLDESIAKMEKIAELKEKIKDKPVEVAKVEEIKTHGKVVTEKEVETESIVSDYVVENAEISNKGYSFWKQPKSDGSLN